MPRVAFVVALLAAVLLVPASAAAQDQRFPNQRAAHEPELDAMLVVAQAFWEARGVLSPCAVTALDVADDLSGVDTTVGEKVYGRGYSPLFGGQDCRIVLDSEWTGAILVVIRNARLPVAERRWNARSLCKAIVHEEGHTRGLPHTATGVMSTGSFESDAATPWECRVLARRLAPRVKGIHHPRRTPVR